jgi:hypothetical protein
LSVPFPLDQGFLRRECPHCEREFKWHHGPTDDRPQDAVDPDVYWCPYCGEPAPPDEWWTPVQLEFATQSLAGPAMQEIATELQQALKSASGFVKTSVEYDEVEAPDALHEPADMVIVQSPCHPWEPVKIAEDWSQPIHCLHCGAPYALG